MKRDFLTEWSTGDSNRERLLAEEALILAVAADLERQMTRSGTSRSQLAERLGTSKAHISQVLTGARNMTLRTLADLAWALEANISVQISPKASRDSSRSIEKKSFSKARSSITEPDRRPMRQGPHT